MRDLFSLQLLRYDCTTNIFLVVNKFAYGQSTGVSEIICDGHKVFMWQHHVYDLCIRIMCRVRILGVAPHCLDPGTVKSATVEQFCGENWEESMQKHNTIRSMSKPTEEAK